MNFADLSHHNPDPINWRVYRATRDRVVLKATEATSFVDNKFNERFRNTLGKRMAYHFQRVGFSAIDQVNHFLETIKVAGFDNSKDCAVIDVEDIDTAGWTSKGRTNTIQLCQAMVSKGFPQGVIYSYRYYLNTIGLKANDLPVGWRKLWIATYTDAISDSNVSLPNGWTRDQVVARQYTDQANVAGITGKCDDNRVIIEWMGKPSTPAPKPDSTISEEDVFILRADKDRPLVLVVFGDFQEISNNQREELMARDVKEYNFTGDTNAYDLVFNLLKH